MGLIRPHAIWAMDLQFDETRDGRQIKLLNIQDIFTRECPAVHVQSSITADDLMNVLDRIVAQHGSPTYLRCDKGPEIRGVRHRRLVPVLQLVRHIHRSWISLSERSH